MLAGEQGPGDMGCEFARRIGGGGQGGQGKEQEQEEGESGQTGPEQRGLVTVVTEGQGQGGQAGPGRRGGSCYSCKSNQDLLQ